jgi:hypothetical protein
MIKSILTFISGIIFSALISAIAFFIWSNHKMTKIHTLEYPLLLATEGQSKEFHMLPKGTTLYFDQAYSEGFTRYKIYINIDRMPLKLEELKDPTAIVPIDAHAPDKDDLQKLISKYPLTKNDLESILKSGSISHEEIQELLEKYAK